MGSKLPIRAHASEWRGSDLGWWSVDAGGRRAGFKTDGWWRNWVGGVVPLEKDAMLFVQLFVLAGRERTAGFGFNGDLFLGFRVVFVGFALVG